MEKRLQLTLFANEADAAPVEAVRRLFNPLQYELIACHVTLCREDELEAFDTIRRNLAALEHPPLTLNFGPAVRFSDGKGIWLPSTGGLETFRRLRSLVLRGAIARPRPAEPHITLMHPRNSTCTEAIFRQIGALDLPARIRFESVSLIEQEAGKKWRILEMFALRGA